ncbi:hypothetical protein Taro_051702, partial [Colocasia esculenta]|nr:hypothetical protein [Colocasia esculenta]
MDHFEDWFSDVDLTLFDVNSGVLTADSGQALALDTAPSGTSVPSTDALAAASGTADSEFQVVPSLPGVDTSDSLSVYIPSPLTVPNLWSPPVFKQTPWEPWPVVWELHVAVVPLPAPPLTITLRTTEGELLQKVSWGIVEREVVSNRPRKRRSKGWEYLRYQPRVSVKLMTEDHGVNID